MIALDDTSGEGQRWRRSGDTKDDGEVAQSSGILYEVKG